MSDTPTHELQAIAAGFAQHLSWRGRRGLFGVAAKSGSLPRSLAVESEFDDAMSSAIPSTESIADVRARLGDCQRCRLAAGRTNLVFGVGNEQAEIMFVGEAPGFDEDRQGEPFVGAAGQLLTRMISAMGLTRGDVYIANIIKCRPPNNRNPDPEEIATCEPFLRAQISAIGPRILIALGNIAAKSLLQTETGITKLRGQFKSYQGIPLMPTFHPAYLLRNPDSKRVVWQDLQLVMARMDELSLKRSRGVL